MITSKNRLSRRTILRGAGVCATLPWLSAMLKPGQSYAQNAPKRLVIFFTPGGIGNLYTDGIPVAPNAVLNEWLPGAGMTLSATTAPLEPLKNKLTFVAGTDLSIIKKGNQNLHQHNRGMAGVLTGAPLEGADADTAWAQGPSLDQVVGLQSKGMTRFQTLEFASGFGTGKSAVGGPHSASSINYADKNVAVPPRQDPLDAFITLFSDETGGPGAASAKEASLQILDKVAAEYGKVSAIVPQEDRMRLEQHMTLISEARASAAIPVRAGCMAPEGINMTKGFYDPKPFDPNLLPGGDNGNSNANPFAGTEVPAKGEAMTKLLVSSLNCGLTNVGTMQWGDSEAKFMLSFLNDPATNMPLVDHHHGYQHDRSPGGNPAVLRVIHNWYYQKLAYLLQEMDKIQEGGATLLDNSLVFHVSELRYAPTHIQTNMPFLLAGGAQGAIQTGRVLQATPGTPHNHLLAAIANIYGVPGAATGFGDPEFAGVLPGLA